MRAVPSEETITFPLIPAGEKLQPSLPADNHANIASENPRAATILALQQTAAELQKTQARLQAELTDLKLLQAVSAELISEHDIGAIYQKLVNAAVSIMRSDFASMQMFYPERGARGALRLLASHGFSEEAQRCWEWVSHETASSCGEVLRSGQRVVATDVEKCDFLIKLGGLEAYLAAGIHSMQSTPLISRSGKLVGMISTHWRQPYEPSERDLRLFDILVRQAADVVERARSEEWLAADLEAMTELYKLGNVCAYAGKHRAQCLDAILEVALTLSHANKGNIQLIDRASGALVIESHRGFSEVFLDFFKTVHNHTAVTCGTAMEKGRRIIVEDITKSELFRGTPSLDVLLGEGVRAVQSTPLVSSTGTVLGMISTYFSEPHCLAERELRMLDLLARQVADYLERMESEAQLRDSQQRARETLECTVADRTAKLRDTVAELEAFSYSIAHDMRAPLRAMHGYARFLEEDFAERLPEEGKEFLHRIASGAGRLDRLITDVLNYSKISRGEMRLEKVEIEKLTREIVDTYPNLSQSGATILIQAPMPAVVGNAAALTQCVSNLLSNAVKFVPAGTKPQVRIRAEILDDIVRFSVEDNGIGIDKEGQTRIFRMFQRLNPATDFEGTGIGLTIVRKAVERMGGQVGVESQRGNGSVFWIKLKLAQ